MACKVRSHTQQPDDAFLLSHEMCPPSGQGRASSGGWGEQTVMGAQSTGTLLRAETLAHPARMLTLTTGSAVRCNKDNVALGM